MNRSVLEIELSSELRTRLSASELVRQKHWVGIHIFVPSVFIQFAQSRNRLLSELETNFDLEVKQGTCDILNYNIEPDKRRNGHGRKLYDIIENFARDVLKCDTMKTFPSGQGIQFWPKMGFNKEGSYYIKRI